MPGLFREGSLTEGWSLAGRGSPECEKWLPKQVQVKERMSSTLNCPTKCPAFMSWGFLANCDFSQSPGSGRADFILKDPARQWGRQPGQDLFLEKLKNFCGRKGWDRWPLLASPRSAHFVFLFSFPAGLWDRRRPCLFLTCSAKTALHWESKTWIQILTLPPAQWVGLGRLVFFLVLLCLKNPKIYGDSDLHSGIVRIK